MHRRVESNNMSKSLNIRDDIKATKMLMSYLTPTATASMGQKRRGDIKVKTVTNIRIQKMHTKQSDLSNKNQAARYNSMIGL
jgi:hypothetical protein